ncbi:hypothetical protein DevBK_11675 [Devosia sp. BK]|uniref:nucleotide-binding protein n=1 Tax=Devosia sp. BK TaxID=2871706 RepID=UPI00293A0941|nr:hypothetical protein [Devosia sp. BK]MDV3251993.1 hypothetical protein [Devosia sp. BK]
MNDKVIARITKKIIAVASQKGGCGKSFGTRCLVQTGRYQGHDVAVYDGDSLIGTTHRALGSRDHSGKLLAEQDPLIGAGRYSLRLDSQREELLNSLATGTSTLVHDLPGGAMLDMAKVVDGGRDGRFDTFLSTVAAYGYELTLLHLVTPEISTMHSVAQYMRAFGGEARHVAVLNRAFGSDNEDFGVWFGSRTRKELLALGGREMNLPALKPSVLAKLDREHLPITVNIPHPKLTVSEGGNLLAFRNAFIAELNTIADWVF